MKIIKFKILILLVMLGILSACSPGMQMSEKTLYSSVFNPQANYSDSVLITPVLVAQMNASQTNTDYKVGEKDILRIRIWEGDNLNTGTLTDGFEVQSNGSIFYSYLGNVQVSGKSIEQIRAILTVKFSEYITFPTVSVEVSEYRSKRVYIMGEVKRPGSYPITDTPISILDAVILGYIDNRTADTGHIFVMRHADESGDAMSDAIVYRFNGASADAMLLASKFYLQANDVVFVAPAGVVSWNRIISNIFPSIALGAH